jgi:gas vesicle protein
MGFFSGIAKFTKGGLFGAAVGAAAALLIAPGTGEETRNALADRIQRTRLAGADAKAATEQQLISRFRGEVNDPVALKTEETVSREEHVQQVAHVQATRPDF